ncbi:MAG: hypothetical protein HRU03_06755, partial [Nanoarchaeales archaeon]|nr:hypothetical protein [Nanoarchaeales archaeon]
IIVAAGAVALGACSSSDSTPKPDKPPVVVVEQGKNLEQVSSEFGGTINTSEILGSLTSGNDITIQNIDFTYTDSNGNLICGDFTSKDDTKVSLENYTFNKLGCTKKLTVSGKSDFSAAKSTVDNSVSNPVLTDSFIGGYNPFNGSDEISFNVVNGLLDSCGAGTSITDNGNGNYTVVTDLKDNISSYDRGIKTSLDCILKNDAGEFNIEGVLNFTNEFDNASESYLVKQIRSGIMEEMLTVGTENPNVVNNKNEYGTRACVNFVEGDSVGYSVQNVSVDGCDVELNIGKTSDFYLNGTSADMTNRLSELATREGTPVQKEHVLVPFQSLHTEYTPNSVEFRNLDTNFTSVIDPVDPRDAGLELTGIFQPNTTDDLGFNSFNIEQITSGYTGVHDRYMTDNKGNYLFGNFGAKLGSATHDNIFTLGGNINDKITPKIN